MPDLSEPAFKTLPFAQLDAAPGSCLAVHWHGGVASGTTNGKLQVSDLQISTNCVSHKTSSSRIADTKWDTAGDVLAVCDAAAAAASSKSSVTLLNIRNGKSKRIDAPEPVTCAAFPPEYAWGGPQAVVLGTAEGSILIAKESSAGLFGQTAFHALHKDAASGRVWDVQLCGSRVAWVTAAGVKLHDVDCGARLLVDKSPLPPQLAALVGEQVPPRLAWLGPEWLSVAWGNRVLVYSVGPSSQDKGGAAKPAAVIRCADIHIDGFVVGVAPFGPSRLVVLQAALSDAGAMGLRATVWPRVFKGGEGGVPEVSESIVLAERPEAKDWLPCDFAVAFHPRITLGAAEMGLASTPSEHSSLLRVFVQTPAEVLQVQPRTLFDHVQWCDDHGLAQQALQVALTLPVPSPQAAVALLQRDTAARLLAGRLQEGLRNVPRLWLWALGPTTAGDGEQCPKSFSLTALTGAFGGGSTPSGDPLTDKGVQGSNSMQHALGGLTAWYLWLLGTVPLLWERSAPPSKQSKGGDQQLSGQTLEDTQRLCTHALGSVWCDGALLAPLLARGASNASATGKLPALVARCLPAAKGVKGGSRKLSQSSSTRDTGADAAAWHPLSGALASTSGLKSLWVTRAPGTHLAVARRVLSCLPVLDAAVPSIVFENILHIMVWLDPACVGRLLSQWAALAARKGGEGGAARGPLCPPEAVTATIQAALKARASAAADGAAKSDDGYRLSVPPFVPTVESLDQLRSGTGLGGVPAPLLRLNAALKKPSSDLFANFADDDAAGSAPAKPVKGGSGNDQLWGVAAAAEEGLVAHSKDLPADEAAAAYEHGTQAPFLHEFDADCFVVESPQQFEANTATLLDVLAEQLMQSGRHHTALRVVLQRASSMMQQQEHGSEHGGGVFGVRGSVDVEGSRTLAPLDLVPPSSGRYAFVFRIIREQKLFEDCIASLPQLLALDAAAALRFCSQHQAALGGAAVLGGLLGPHAEALLDASSATCVDDLVAAAPGVSALQLRCVTAYAALLAQGAADGWTVFDSDALAPWRPLVLVLLAHFAPGQVMPLLQRCKGVDAEGGLGVLRAAPCQRAAADGAAAHSAAPAGLWMEIALLLQRSGALESSLDLLIGTLRNVKQAVHFVQMVSPTPKGPGRKRNTEQRPSDGLTAPWRALLQQLKTAPVATSAALWGQLLDELPAQGDHVHALATVRAMASLQGVPHAKRRLHRLLQAQSLTAAMHRTVLAGAEADQRQKHLGQAFQAAHGVHVPADATCALSGLPLSAGVPSGDAAGHVHELLEDGTSADMRVAAALASSGGLKAQDKRRAQQWAGAGAAGGTGSASDAASDDSHSVGSGTVPGMRGGGGAGGLRRGSRSSSVDSLGAFGHETAAVATAVPKSSAVITWGGQHYLMGALQRHSPAAVGAIKATGGPSLPLGLLKA